MSHDINVVNGKASFFTVKEPAWHNLGKILDNCPTSAEAIVHAGLDFTVAKTQVHGEFRVDPEQEGLLVDVHYLPVPNRYATYRTDTKDIFGIVSDRYEIIQNKEAFSFFDAIVGKGQAIYETAGALGKGEVIFITAKLPGHIKVIEEGEIEKYLLLTMAHDGSKAITAMFTPIRVVCANTLSQALEGTSNRVHVRHTSNAKRNLEQAHVVLGITKRLSDSMEEVLKRFAETPIDDFAAELLLKEAFLTEQELTSDFDKLSETKKNLLVAIWNYYNIGIGQSGIRGTLYGLYNGVTGYFQNAREYRNESSKFRFIYQNEGARISQFVFNKCYQLLKEKK